ncbi:hypothetical protein [Sphingosinicella rhizophila]|uniref:PilZ domain-containing protein n=1 Tax=Sphingosinicella rhizophila TaxID=3050082 RepID=A0ABU3Q515_9SPHN|nr:hypothetical protein [Sphingosinicella sp. GR2756]MDT9598407.1 hypothetical protein [Sphingosinicella sp. GR2756]
MKMKVDEAIDPHFKERRSVRNSVETKTQLRQQNLYNVEVTIRDVSTAGFMAECVEPVQIGSYVALEVPGLGPIRAQVRWQLAGRMGGMFLDPISLDKCKWEAVRAEEPA